MRCLTLDFSKSFRMVTEDCSTCGIVFAMPTEFRQERIDDRCSFYCPSGHRMNYIGQSVTQRLQEALETERHRRELAERRATNASERATSIQRRLSAAKGQATKARKRAAAGVCPCCQRSFTAMAEHIRTEHPTFSPELPDV